MTFGKHTIRPILIPVFSANPGEARQPISSKTVWRVTEPEFVDGLALTQVRSTFAAALELANEHDSSGLKAKPVGWGPGHDGAWAWWWQCLLCPAQMLTENPAKHHAQYHEGRPVSSIPHCVPEGTKPGEVVDNGA